MQKGLKNAYAINVPLFNVLYFEPHCIFSKYDYIYISKRCLKRKRGVIKIVIFYVFKRIGVCMNGEHGFIR